MKNRGRGGAHGPGEVAGPQAGLTTVRIGEARAAELLAQVNAVLCETFESAERLLEFYRREFPGRVGAYRQEEVGPVYHQDGPGAADAFVRGEFTLGGRTLTMKGGLDWYGTPDGDLEWNGGLVRHGYFMLLADEYERTGNELYAKTILDHLVDWAERVPPFNPDGKPYLEYKKSTWRPFEAAGRAAENWPVALRKIIGSRSMTPAIWVRIVWSVYEHARFLRERHWKTGNHAVLEVADLGIISIFFREFRESAGWRTYALEFLDRMWPELFHSDGYTKEMSGGYHWVAMRNFFAFYEVAAANGLAHIFPPRYRERLTGAALAELLQEKPDFSVPVTNDSNSRMNRRPQLERIESVLGIPEVSWRLSAGARGLRPRYTSFFFPEARMAFMRTGWGAEDLCLSFDMGRWGDNHMNEDQLAVELSGYGRRFLVNCGRWRYTTSDPAAAWMPRARYFKRTESYSSLIVDGYPQLPGDADGFMTIVDSFEYAAGVFRAGYGDEAPETDEALLSSRGIAGGRIARVTDALHRREVYFVKSPAPFPFWIVRDTLEVTGPGERKAEQIWHGMEGEFCAEGRSGTGSADAVGFWKTDFPDANLYLVSRGEGGSAPEAACYHGSEDPVAGWHCPYYDEMVPAPELRFSLRGKRRIVLSTLLLPVRGALRDEPGPEFSVTGKGFLVRFRDMTVHVPATLDRAWTLEGTE